MAVLFCVHFWIARIWNSNWNTLLNEWMKKEVKAQMNQILNIKSAEKHLKHIFLNCSSHEPFLHKLIEDTHRISQASKVMIKILQARLQ